VFFEVILAQENSPVKMVVKMAKVRKLIPNFYFPEKWLQKIWVKMGDFWWFGLVRFLPVFTGL